MRSFLFSFMGFTLGLFLGYYFLFLSPKTLLSLKKHFFSSSVTAYTHQKQIIGFLPYWLVEKAQRDYSDAFSTLTYFGLVVGADGKIQYLANESEEEPGYHILKSKRLHDMLSNAQKNDMTLSLLVFSGDADAIDELISNPTEHAKNLVGDVKPIMEKYGFTDLNLDIEHTRMASEEARTNFTTFIQAVKQEVMRQKLGTLTVEITGQDLIKKTLINPKEITEFADFVVIMAYDFHYQGSLVTGPVAPLGGAESIAEFDTNIVLQQAYKVIPKNKIILGIPSYGYSWETLLSIPKSATIPGSGITTSNAKAETFLKECTTCSAQLDKSAQESYVIYKDTETGTYHQIFYPDKNAVQKKVDVVKKNNLGGLAVWALGYENIDIYQPLSQYKKDTFDITRL